MEVEEEPETAMILDMNEQAKLMTQGQWMKGCPEGGEQSFLFSLYRELSEGECKCPHGCGTVIARSKRDFFPLFVSGVIMYAPAANVHDMRRQTLGHTPRICARSFHGSALAAEGHSAMHAENP